MDQSSGAPVLRLISSRKIKPKHVGQYDRLLRTVREFNGKRVNYLQLVALLTIDGLKKLQIQFDDMNLHLFVKFHHLNMATRMSVARSFMMRHPNMSKNIK